MKIATYNVNGINGRLPVLLRWLKEAKPDVVCLQELKATDDKFPEVELKKAGYNAIWHGQKSWNGVAILAKGRTRWNSNLPLNDKHLKWSSIQAVKREISEIEASQKINPLS